MHRSPVEAEAAEVVEDVNRSPIVEAEAKAAVEVACAFEELASAWTSNNKCKIGGKRNEGKGLAINKRRSGSLTKQSFNSIPSPKKSQPRFRRRNKHVSTSR